jgi:hypothetical protein
MELNGKACVLLRIIRRHANGQEGQWEKNNENIEGLWITAESVDGTKVKLVIDKQECEAIRKKLADKS